MGMPNLAKMWTREEVLALPDDGNRYAAVLALFRLLDPYVSGNRLGRLMLSPADLDLRSNQLVQPDLFVVPAIGNRRPARWDECGIPILIVEVLSPSTARYDRMTKRRRYQRSGVPVLGRRRRRSIGRSVDPGRRQAGHPHRNAQLAIAWGGRIPDRGPAGILSGSIG